MKPSSLIVLALLALGCSQPQRIPDKVLEADLSKLDPAMTSQLQAAREEAAQAQVELTGAGRQLAEARQEGSLSDSDRKAAEAETDRVKKLAEVAETRRRAAEARRDYADKLLDAHEAMENAAKLRVELADAKLELLKFQAVETTNAQAVAKFDKSAFYERVAKAQRQHDEARGKASKLQDEVTAKRARWEDLARKVQ
jgi:chromosome segregation ATPase